MDHITTMTAASSDIDRISKLPLALTMGEPAGIGPELAIDAWLRLRESGLSFVLFADPDMMTTVVRELRRDVPIGVVRSAFEAANRIRNELPVVPVKLAQPVQLGVPDSANASAVIRSIELEVAAARRGEVGGVVTNLIQKATLYAAGFRHPGHTEFLGEIAGAGIPPVMMLASPELRVVPVTIHVALRDALAAISSDAIVETAKTVVNALRWDFGIEAPRIAIAGVNPHAGEDGAMGDEDIRIVAPAVKRLHEAGIAVAGPMSPDTMFTARAQGLRRRDLHVSRSGTYPAQDPRCRRRCERHARPFDREDLAGSRNGTRYRRQGRRRCWQSSRGNPDCRYDRTQQI